MGRVLVVEQMNLEVHKYRPENLQQETEKFLRYHSMAVQETQTMIQEAQGKLGQQELDILDAQLTLLQDEYSVVTPIMDTILQEGINASCAIDKVMTNIVQIFNEAEDEYLRARANDAEDVRRRLLTHTLGLEIHDYASLPEGTILAAEELTPSDTIRMDLAHVSGIITAVGGYYSHVGIISRNLGIPSLCGLNEALKVVQNGDTAIVDGDEGVFLLQPDLEQISRFEERFKEKRQAQAELDVFRTRNSVSSDGETGLLCANIGSLSEAQLARSSGAEGIGLMRSEFLYMDQPSLPDEETQMNCYRQVLETMEGLPVIIRTLDVGGDKSLPALPMPKEDNPFLGCRAIRLCLNRQDLFRTQLRALLRASVYGNLKIMFPMISSLGELRTAKALLNQARKELTAEGVSTAPVEVGIMIEVPSAAVLADCLAKEVDFFSIGTNDLIQYTLAAERGNPAVESLYSPYHPAVLRLINATAQAAIKEHIMCGMCGEAAANPALLPVFWGMGLRELSMSPGVIAQARKTLSSWRTQDCQALASQVLLCSSEEDVLSLLNSPAILKQRIENSATTL